MTTPPQIKFYSLQRLKFKPSYILVLLGFFLLLFVFGCKRSEDENQEVMPPAPNYSNLEVGNYWIYERINLSQDGIETPLGIFDSLYIEKDTTIAGNKYFKYWTTNFGSLQFQPVFLRDSLHFTVTSIGSVFFGHSDVAMIITDSCLISGADTIYCLTETMLPNNSSIETDVGIFQCRDLVSNYQFYTNQIGGNNRSRHKFASEGIGIVYETLPFLASDPNYTIRKLVRYGKAQ